MIDDSIKNKIIDRMERYCAYRDRCHQEVRTKLLSLKVYGDELEEILIHLMQEGFLNEERYAKSYVRGKFRMNQWGKVKIQQNLLRKNISSYCIRKGMEEIDPEEYQNTLIAIVEKEVNKLTPPINKIVLTRKIMNKGYEYPLVVEALKRY